MVEIGTEVSSPRRLLLSFNAGRVEAPRVGGLIETLLAPALLPRGTANMQILQALRDWSLRIPLPGSPGASWEDLGLNLPLPGLDLDGIGSVPGLGSNVVGRGSRGGTYLITYVDEDMMVGRSLSSGSVFVFERATETGK